MDKRIREWCFGSFDGAYDGDPLWGGYSSCFQGRSCSSVILCRASEGLVEVDTAGWAEGWEKLSARIRDGFGVYCQRNGRTRWGQCSRREPWNDDWDHCVSDQWHASAWPDNGSVTILEYEDGQFSVEVVGDRSYRELGREKMEENKH